MKITNVIIRGFITAILILMAMKWGENHPNKIPTVTIHTFEHESDCGLLLDLSYGSCDSIVNWRMDTQITNKNYSVSIK